MDSISIVRNFEIFVLGFWISKAPKKLFGWVKNGVWKKFKKKVLKNGENLIFL